MAKNKMVSVNKERLVYAREFYGLDVTDVAEKTKISLDKILDFENGNDFPTYAELTKLSDFYRKPLLYFFFVSVPDPQKDEMAIAFRSLEQTDHKHIGKQTREMMEKANVYKLNLEEMYHESTPCFLDILKNETVTENNFSYWLRNKLNVPIEEQLSNYYHPDTLLEKFRNELYQLGIYVFKDSFRDDSVSGLCLFDNQFPIILLNNKMTFSRQLFTLFHEVYHVFINSNDVDFSKSNEERACNQFASHFLIPSDALSKSIDEQVARLGKISISDLSNEFCVSIDAMAYRLYQEEQISKPEYDSIHLNSSFVRGGNQTSGGNYYNTKKAYLGEGYINKVYNDYYNGTISISEVSMYTQMKASSAKAFALKFFGGDSR